MAAVVIAYYAAKAAAAHCGWWQRQKSLRRTMVGGGGDYGGVLCINNGGKMLWLVANIAAASNIMETAAYFTVASIRTVRHPDDAASTPCYVDISVFQWCPELVSSFRRYCGNLSFRQYPENMAAFRRPDGNLVLLCRPELRTTFPGVCVVRPSTAYGTVVSCSVD
ncbi:17134_t:CDS:2 [Acaulospora morrowiae]|uniref:17134_t:CDS:1 n=1 Tax=Acaulospora morrowiae TaxID=94023 RepID=A0A9N9FVL7_9GLOM|nr:17134_t:CDS:2 [Acaulospora morrowiae]